MNGFVALLLFTACPLSSAPLEDFSSLGRIFPRSVSAEGQVLGIDQAAVTKVQEGARVRACALQWEFTLNQGWAALSIIRPLKEPVGCVRLWVKNPFGHRISLALRAVSATGMLVGFPERDISSARNWSELSWHGTDGTVLACPAASEPLPVTEWTILAHGPAGARCCIFLDEFGIEPTPEAHVGCAHISPAGLAKPGERIAVELDVDSGTRSCFQGLRLELRDGAGPVAWAPLAPVLPTGRVRVDLALPSGLRPGRYGVVLDGDGVSVVGRASDGVEIDVGPPGGGGLFARDQGPDTSPISGLIWAVPAQPPVEEATPRILVPLTCNFDGIGPGADGASAEDPGDFVAVDRVINQTLQIHPSARVVPKIYVGASPEWLAAHPEDAVVFRPSCPAAPIGPIRDFPSLASPTWLRSAAGQVRAVIEHIEHSPWAAHIAGYILAGGDGLWGWPGAEGAWPDFSQAAARGFRTFLRDRYKTLENLRSAWGQPRRPVLELLKDAPPDEPRPVLSWDEIAIPDVERCRAHPLSLLEPPAFNDVVDYRLFLAHASAQAAAAMARAARAVCQKPVGVTYRCWLSDDWPGAFLGALGLDELLREDAVTFVVFPARGVAGAALPVSMVRRAGKRVVAAAEDWSDADQGMGAELAAARRPDALVLQRPLPREQLDRIVETLSSPPASPQVALVGHAESAAVIAHGDLSRSALAEQIREVAGCGVAYDIWSLSQIDDPALRKCRVVLFLNPYRLDEADRAAIEGLKDDGRLLVFSFAAGAMRPMSGINGR
ncbi:MAG: hypothetical protein H5T86_04165, partial [Armatimonadetes bacterium]|nr:hypothetical protein [Armatimonadota bacterium]